MKLDGQTEADLGFYICFIQIYQSLGLEVTPWSRGWSGCYADSHTNLLGNQKYNHVDFWHGTVYTLITYVTRSIQAVIRLVDMHGVPCNVENLS